MTMSTKDVAMAIGVKAPTLQKWVREGLLTPETEGNGSQKRIIWSRADVAQASALADRGGRSSATSLLDELAPSGVLPYLIKAQTMRDTVAPNKVIIVSERGIRLFDHDTPVGEAMSKVAPDGRGMLLLLQ